MTDWKYDGFPAYFKMGFYHGLIDDELYEQGKENCDFSYIEVHGGSKYSEVCKKTLLTFLKYTQYANTWDIYAKCYKNQPVPCLWTQPIVEYFSDEEVKD